jgi:beta-glucosidase
LSYTTFEYRDLALKADGVSVTVTLKVKNTGKVAGKEIVQVYVRDVESTVFHPAKELKGFAKVALQPGEETAVSIDLNRRAFAFYEVNRKDWVVEAGDFEILVGASSQDIRVSSTLHLDSAQQAAPVADREKLAPYYTLAIGTPISREAFEALYGRPLPINQNPQKGNYTLNTPIGDMSDSFIGRMLYKLMNRTVRNMFKSTEEENPLLDMIESMLKEMPLRSMAMMSNGTLKRQSLDALLVMINGRFFKGLLDLLKSVLAK